MEVTGTVLNILNEKLTDATLQANEDLRSGDPENYHLNLGLILGYKFAIATIKEHLESEDTTK